MTDTAFGFWPSPITPQMVAQASNKIAFPRGHGDWLYWQECFADEGNRWVVRGLDVTNPSQIATLSPDGQATSSKVHEYGGISYGVWSDGLVWVAKADQAIYAYRAGEHRRLFQAEGWAFGEPVPSAAGVIVIAEQAAKPYPRNFLVLIHWSGEMQVLHEGEDFYAAPALAPNGRDIAWLSWNMPDMPWQQTTLWQATLAADGAISDITQAWAAKGVALFQPSYAPSGALYVVQNSEDFGLITRVCDRQVVSELAGEHSLPLWQLGMRSYAPLADGGFATALAQDGRWQLAHKDILDIAGAHVSDPVAVAGGFAALVYPCDRPPELCYWAENSHGVVVHRAGVPLDIQAIVPKSINFVGKAGMVQGYFYAPKGVGKPPVIIKSHGGPSGQTDPSLNLKIQFWVSRGFAVFDVNYSGSTGFGRGYMQRLDGQWGILDVQDCLSGIAHLVSAGLVDGKAAFVSGGSAGGLTTLGCLVASDAFAGGVSAYGVADLEGLAAITHKFEARYLDGLVGRLPEDQAIYRARSPLYHAHRISAPVLFLQGGKDVVVPPVQTNSMVEAITQQPNAPEVRVVRFPDEGHGFRAPETIIAALEAELGFYQDCLSCRTRT